MTAGMLIVLLCGMSILCGLFICFVGFNRGEVANLTETRFVIESIGLVIFGGILSSAGVTLLLVFLRRINAI